MKKIKVLLAAVLSAAMFLTACGGSSNGNGSAAADTTTSVEKFDQIWEKLTDDLAFPAMGGGYSNTVDGKPGELAMDDCSSLFYTTDTENAMIEDGSCVMHMMNANTFTGGVFKLKNASDVQTFSDNMKEILANNMWICGFPERLNIVQIGERSVLLMFGEGELVNGLTDIAKTVFTDAKVLVDIDL